MTHRIDISLTFPPLGAGTIEGLYLRPSTIDELIVIAEREEAESESPDTTAHWARLLQWLYDTKAKIGGDAQ